MRGISVRGVLTSHIGGNVWSPPSHRESLLRLASVPFLRRNRTRDAGLDLPRVREVGKGRVCHKHAYAWMIDVAPRSRDTLSRGFLIGPPSLRTSPTLAELWRVV